MLTQDIQNSLELLGIWVIATIITGLLIEYSSNKSKDSYNKLH